MVPLYPKKGVSDRASLTMSNMPFAQITEYDYPEASARQAVKDL
jgi:hypothetical protein